MPLRFINPPCFLNHHNLQYPMKKFTILLSLTVWLTGTMILLFKASQLLLEAYRISNTALWPMTTLGIGLLLGLIKTKAIFIPFCQKNLIRIEKLEAPKLWQAFTVKFWFMLTLMIIVGTALSRMAHGNLLLLSIVAAIDLMVGSGLLFSTKIFIPKNRES